MLYISIAFFFGFVSTQKKIQVPFVSVFKARGCMPTYDSVKVWTDIKRLFLMKDSFQFFFVGTNVKVGHLVIHQTYFV